MNKLLSRFLDRLFERLTGLMASFISSHAQRFQAEIQAEQQSELEDLARRYEADGKPQIAASLRQRAARITSIDLAEEGAETIDRVSEQPALPAPVERSGDNVHRLPDFTTAPASARKSGRKRRATNETQNREDTP